MILERLFIAGGGVDRAEPGAKDRAILTATIESVLLPVLCLALSLGLRRHDPFFLSAAFPWIWLAPVLVALRYGSYAALVASLTLVSGWSLAAAFAMDLPPYFPKQYFLGGFMIAFICGEFRDLWQAENRRQRLARHHLAIHLDELNHAHQVLAQSHERLMADFIQHPPTLRDALAELPRPESGRMDEAAAKALLEFLARYFKIETASLHVMEASGLKAAPLAALGQARRLNGSEALIAACLRERTLCHAAEGARPEPYLCVVPIISSSSPEWVLAVLAIESMPFFAFETENLRQLAAVLGYYADSLGSTHLAAPILAQMPDCPSDFAAECLRLYRIEAQAGLPSALACRIAPEGSAIAEPERSSPKSRAIDRIWVRTLPDGRALRLALLPFCNEEQAFKALERIYPVADQAKIAPPGSIKNLITTLKPLKKWASGSAKSDSEVMTQVLTDFVRQASAQASSATPASKPHLVQTRSRA